MTSTKEIQKEIFNEIFSGSSIGLSRCDCGYFVVFEQSKKTFPLKIVQPLLKKLLDDKLIKSNKGLQKIANMKEGKEVKP